MKALIFQDNLESHLPWAVCPFFYRFLSFAWCMVHGAWCMVHGALGPLKNIPDEREREKRKMFVDMID